MRADGVHIYDICDYDVPLYSIVGSVLSFVNDALYRGLGPRGFFDPFWMRWR